VLHMPRPYSTKFREGAIALAGQGERSVPEIANEPGMAGSCLRNWLKQDEVDRHERDDGMTTSERS
jgi:transposase